ncbi:MAG: hypothetical protein OFPII_06750 [Osedax symbiont Rs1]|nr:MAG: hypothetical protein OFPII_06750 [Osedax symbiont Rs1]
MNVIKFYHSGKYNLIKRWLLCFLSEILLLILFENNFLE